MNLSILHLSDLHRDPSNEITSDALLDSLERDRRRYTRSEEPQIRSPDIIIICGDVIQGVKSDAPNPYTDLSNQYDQAMYFLSNLAKHFVGGDKNRVILVPGNHDVNAHHLMSCVKKLEVDRDAPSTRHIVQQLFSPGSIFRWSWDVLDVFEIVDIEAYHRRLEDFCKFYASFYEGQRTFDIDPANQFDIFDYPEFNIVIVGLSSCFHNDLFNKQGAIHPDSLARASKELHHRKYWNRLRLAVWHHNTSGAPLKFDYMDADILQVLIDSGFSIGFHGHQHKPQFIDERFKFGEGSKITVVSAGTLCGGPGVLPSGHARAYNILEIDTQSLRAKLHLRRMQNENFSSPIWGPGSIPKSLKSYVEFDIQPPPEMVSGGAEAVQILSEAERLIHDETFHAAVKILVPLAHNNLLARRLLIECYVGMDDTKSIIEEFDPPESTTEIVYLADALWAERKLERLNELLNNDIVTQSTDPSVIEVRSKYLERLG